MIHLLRLCVLGSVIAICGCASASGSPSDADSSYQAALKKCRRLQPGRLNQRLNLPPTSLRVSECLRKHGWAPDGSRLD
jgi:hypothetical protein